MKLNEKDWEEREKPLKALDVLEDERNDALELDPPQRTGSGVHLPLKMVEVNTHGPRPTHSAASQVLKIPAPHSWHLLHEGGFEELEFPDIPEEATLKENDCEDPADPEEEIPEEATLKENDCEDPADPEEEIPEELRQPGGLQDQMPGGQQMGVPTKQVGARSGHDADVLEPALRVDEAEPTELGMEDAVLKPEVVDPPEDPALPNETEEPPEDEVLKLDVEDPPAMEKEKLVDDVLKPEVVDPPEDPALPNETEEPPEDEVLKLDVEDPPAMEKEKLADDVLKPEVVDPPEDPALPNETEEPPEEAVLSPEVVEPPEDPPEDAMLVLETEDPPEEAVLALEVEDELPLDGQAQTFKLLGIQVPAEQIPVCLKHLSPGIHTFGVPPQMGIPIGPMHEAGKEHAAPADAPPGQSFALDDEAEEVDAQVHNVNPFVTHDPPLVQIPFFLKHLSPGIVMGGLPMVMGNPSGPRHVVPITEHVEPARHMPLPLLPEPALPGDPPDEAPGEPLELLPDEPEELGALLELLPDEPEEPLLPDDAVVLPPDPPDPPDPPLPPDPPDPPDPPPPPDPPDPPLLPAPPDELQPPITMMLLPRHIPASQTHGPWLNPVAEDAPHVDGTLDVTQDA